MLTTTISTALWGVKEGIFGAFLVPLALLTLGGALFVMNQVLVYRRRNNQGFASQDNQGIEKTVRQWLDRERYKIQSDPQSNMLFQIKVEDESRRVLVIARAKDLPEFILVGGVWNVPLEDQAKINKDLSASVREEMFTQMRLELLRLGVGYVGIEYPLTKFGFEIRVACDETCTKSNFLDQFSRAKYAYVMATEIIRSTMTKNGLSLSTSSSIPVPNLGKASP